MIVPEWWQDAVGYQIYPRSFADSNGDGIGDLPGIIDKLDYLQRLGITVVWLSPFYPSPQFDVGYDISDYTDVNPEYGTLADFDRLLAEAHRRGIRIMLDCVMNHTSDEHPWFQESRSSRDSPKRDWYIWRDARHGGPPNNWESVFGGSVWTLDEATGQYYYHHFFARQPDLNWRNPEVRAAMYDVVRFWYARGVDGLRLDAIGALYEVEDLRDTDETRSMIELWMTVFENQQRDWDAFQKKIQHQVMQPETFQEMNRLRAVNDEFEERVLLAEAEDIEYYHNGLHSVFNFDLTDVNELDADKIRAVLSERGAALPDGAWESNTIGNHDRTRSMSVFADGQHDRERMIVALAMVMFLRGTPMFYNGEEIGMRDWLITDPADFRDMLGVWAYETAQGLGFDDEQALHVANIVSRDKNRTPMQWENAPNAGFSPEGVRPWLAVNPDYAEGTTVVGHEVDPQALLHAFRELVQVRQNNVTLRRGDMELLEGTGPVLAFWRRHSEQTCLVALNMAAESAALNIDLPAGLRPVYSSQTHDGAQDTAQTVHLAPYEVFVAAAE
ncbi:MAG: alpha-glucosidase [Chloroflexi bacterium]|nr:alpha-glucosidase [Chloroflexota bacterium]